MAEKRGATQGRRAARSAATADPEEVARVAYELYERRGREPGREIDDWIAAEQLVLARTRNGR